MSSSRSNRRALYVLAASSLIVGFVASVLDQAHAGWWNGAGVGIVSGLCIGWILGTGSADATS